MTQSSKPASSDTPLSKKTQEVQSMFDRIAPKYDFLNRLLSARQDVRWRNALVALLPKIENNSGILADIACGTGDVMLQVGQKRKDYNQLWGFDISAGMLESGKNRSDIHKLQHNRASLSEKASENFAVTFAQASAENLPLEGESVNAVSIAFGLRNVDDRNKALKEFHRVIKKDGRLLVLEFFSAKNSAFSKAFQFYFENILPQIAGIFSDKSAYQYLPRSVTTMPSGVEFIRQLEGAGFENIVEKQWLNGAVRLFTGDVIK